MLLLYCTDMYSDIVKYQKLLALCLHTKPTHVIINGNLFATKKNGNSDGNQIMSIIGEISKNSMVLLNLGGFDSLANSNNLKNLQNKNIKNLTNDVVIDQEYRFIGISHTTPTLATDWRMNDGSLDFDAKLQNSDLIIRQNCHGSDFLRTIFVSYLPPLGILDYDQNPLIKGSYNIRSLCEGTLTGEQPVLLLCGSAIDNFGYTREWYKILGRCLCIQPSQDENLFYFSLLEIEPVMNILTFYHPYDRIETMKKLLDYKTIL